MGLFRKENKPKASNSEEILKVKQLLDTVYGIEEFVELKPGIWVSRTGSSIQTVEVVTDADTPPYVCFEAEVLVGVDDSDKLYRYLLREEQRQFFSWVVRPSETLGKVDVGLMRSVYIDDLDAEELRWVTSSAVNTADEIDNDLKKRFGGELSGDVFDSIINQN